MDDSVLASDYKEWRRHKVTKALVRDLLKKREFLKEGLAEDRLEDGWARGVTVGRCQALRDAIEYIVSDFDTIEDSTKEDSKTQDD
jgi:hypothetical protein